MGTVLLSVRDCSFGYKGSDFRLRDVSLEVSRGEVLGIIGPNGSGKSTLLRLMGGFQRPDGGEVSLQGAPIRSFSRRELARDLAFLPQNPETSFRFSVRQVVAMGRYPYLGSFAFLTRHDVEVVERALSETESTGFGERNFFTLSGGEKQRVLIASVLAQEPSVMLLDEPTAALDIHHRCEVLGLLRDLSRKGIAVVVVTHDLNAASQFCNRLVLLAEGSVLRRGGPHEVMDPELLSRAYRADVRVAQNPITGAPMAVVLGGGSDEAG